MPLHFPVFYLVDFENVAAGLRCDSKTILRTALLQSHLNFELRNSIAQMTTNNIRLKMGNRGLGKKGHDEQREKYSPKLVWCHQTLLRRRRTIFSNPASPLPISMNAPGSGVLKLTVAEVHETLAGLHAPGGLPVHV